MAFDETWEKIFKARSWGRYPSEDVVRFVASRFSGALDRGSIRILDLGCGGGAHTWFLAREGFDTYAIDGSESGIRQATALLQESQLTAKFVVGDFTRLDYQANFFDAIIDSSAIQHNTMCDIRVIHNQIWNLLKPGGHFCGIMINTETAGWTGAEQVEINTLKNFDGGPIQSELLVHFFTIDEVNDLMSRFDRVAIEKTTRTTNGGAFRYGHFVVAGQKPNSSD